MAQTLKIAAKPAKTRAPRVSKPAAKPAEQAAAKPVAYFIAPGMRPNAGAHLFAHTAVFMQATGMLEGKAVPSELASKVIGARAIKWHEGEGNFTTTEKGIELTAAGKEKFAKRQISAELRAGYEAILIEGKADERTVIKNASLIHPLTK